MSCNCGFTPGDVDYLVYALLHLKRETSYTCLCSFCWRTFETQFRKKMNVIRTLSSCKSSPPYDLVGEVPLHPTMQIPEEESNQAA